MLNFLSAGNQNVIVGVALTPGVGLEAILIDKAKRTVLNYGRRKVEYNFQTREIQDYNQFKTGMIELFDEMRVPPKSMVYLVLPNVYSDFIKIPNNIEDNNQIKTIILSEAENFYLFQREEPISGWCQVINNDADMTKRLLYTSFQKGMVDQLKDILADIGMQLIGVESNYSALLRGLNLTGLTDDLVAQNAYWTVMLVNSNSYVLFQMEGKNLLEFNEVPLATKSLSPEEAYQSIISSSYQMLDEHSTTRLYIVSQTNNVCAEVLRKQLHFKGESVAIDTNKFSKRQLMQVAPVVEFSQANSLTLSVIGAADVKTDYGLKLNVLADDPAASMGIYFKMNLLGTELEVTKKMVEKLSLSLCGFIAVIFLILNIAGFVVKTQILDKGIKDTNKKIEMTESKIQELSSLDDKKEVDITEVIDEVAAENINAINYYDSIATDIPNNVWLAQYYNRSGDRIAIRGVAENIVDIYEYYKNLRVVSPQSDIKLTELKVITGEEGNDKLLNNISIDKETDRLYSFEISNTQIQTGIGPAAGSQEQGGQQQPNNLINRVPSVNLEQPSMQMIPEEER